MSCSMDEMACLDGCKDAREHGLALLSFSRHPMQERKPWRQNIAYRQDQSKPCAGAEAVAAVTPGRAECDNPQTASGSRGGRAGQQGLAFAVGRTRCTSRI